MARRTIIAGNWKMNLLPAQGEELVVELKEKLVDKENLEVVVFPQASLIPLAQDWIVDSTIQLGAQNSSDKLSGAYTGETSPILLRTLGCSYCLAGHSERRVIFGETSEWVGKKAQTLISVGIVPIVCIGESLTERESGRHLEIIEDQLVAVYDQVAKEAWPRLVFAYEPVWAIGTGKTATPEQAEEVHRYIRKKIEGLAGEIVANATGILYGGSVKPSNAADLLVKENIDGFLVGGASLDAEDFSKIIAAF
ncbi:MAG: triose-phosphate isomerase [Proteobacteria bacterium]|nr:triose-phosphate isomerase [Pseudomonadota bacterium]